MNVTNCCDGCRFSFCVTRWILCSITPTALKNSAAEELVTAIRRVLRGESYMSPEITKGTVDFLIRVGEPGLREKRITKRQREVLQLLAEGRSMKEVADVLDLKPGTVAFHKYRIMESLGVETNAQLLQYAIKQHMISS